MILFRYTARSNHISPIRLLVRKRCETITRSYQFHHQLQKQHRQQQRHNHSRPGTVCRYKSTINNVDSTSEASLRMVRQASEVIDRPTNQQLFRVFTLAAVPMIGFGFMDQTVMVQAGNMIDCTIGVTFGLSTLTAAAFGQICSDAAGVLFGGTLESLSIALGLPKANLTTAQRALPLVRRVKLAGSLIGVITGCCLGLLNLLFIDTGRSSTLKLQAFNEEQEFEFDIEASNILRNDATALKVTGPDVDGLLASMTAALAVRGCSLVELHAQRKHNINEGDEQDERKIEDIFYVINRETGKPFDDDELEELARGLLDSTRTPMNVNSVKAAMHELERTNTYLQNRIRKLEQVVYDKQITIIKRSDNNNEVVDEVH